MTEFWSQLLHLEGAEKVTATLRWLALGLVILLSFFDPFEAGVLVPVSTVILGAAIYNLLIQALGHIFPWPRLPLNVLALDTLVATVAIYLTGGFHSSFFIVYYFIILGIAFHLNLVQTVLLALLINFLYAAICFINPAGRQIPWATYSLAATSAILLMIAILCALFLEQLHHERLETERERALVTRLRALNELFQRLGTSLDLQHVLQTVVTASCRFLEADVALISLMEQDGHHLRLAALQGLDPASLSDERWLADEELVDAILEEEGPYLVEDLSTLSKQLPSLQAVQQEGIVSGASMPLLLDEEAIGFLNVGYFEPHRCTEGELSFLSGLGQEAALAVRNVRVYEAERRQVEQLQDLEQLQSNFIFSVSHELQTPLTIMKTSLGLLKEEGSRCSEETRRELVETISHHTERLEDLVADLLEVTRLEAGQVTLSRQPTDMHSIAEQAVQDFAPLAKHKRQVLALDLPPDPCLVSVDRRRIEQVLDNLLSNAHKFTPKGGEIRVSLRESEEEVEVSVGDNGPGIPLAEQERIFEKFYARVNGQGATGIGLGLYLARQFVSLHSGRIWVESQPGKGSTFRFTIPKMGA
ncbi:MAG: ATP-binding protein [Chloroflexota bacterium]|nr:ATP-binding protein [Chloroflexota bacterium]